jgi:hypothetical protein
MYLTEFSEGVLQNVTAWVRIGLRLCAQLIPSGELDGHELLKWLFVHSAFDAFVCISCWATVFSNIVTREQSEH